MTHLAINLHFSLTSGEESTTTGSALAGTIKADGRDIEVSINDAAALDKAPKEFIGYFRAFAQWLADRDLSVTVSTPQGEMVRFGAIENSFLQRRLTRSKYIRLSTLKRLPKIGSQERKSSFQINPLVPPPTPWPLIPMINRHIRKPRITTTHYGREGAGRPRLILTRMGERPSSRRVFEFNLKAERTVLGSDDSCDLQLPGLDPVHAEIRHNNLDEYALTAYGAAGGISGAHQAPVTLRTGARIDMGPWRVVFIRAEYADHGRPFGGRQGGEFAQQKPQPDPYRQ